MKIIILAGGFGTRLKKLVPDKPKSMAPISGKPFLDYIVTYLSNNGCNDIILSIHHMKEQIIDYFSNFSNKNVNFSFISEDEPLGTGGAILHSINKSSVKGDVIAMNGDSFFDINIKSLIETHKSNKANLTIALCRVPDTSRYGRVSKENNIITAFHEKGVSGEGLINTGIYVINAEWFKSFNLPKKFSIGSDFFCKYISEIKPNFYIHEGYFIDIGIEEDYKRAQTEIPKFF